MSSRKPTASGITSIDTALEMPGHLLRRCHQIAVAVFLEACAGFDLTPPQYVTLTALASDGPLDKATIGGIAALDRTTVAVVLKNLGERGLVETRASEQDRRATLSEITAKGRALLEAAQHAAQEAQLRILSPLAAEERTELVRLLGKMARENNLLSRAPRRGRRG